MNIEQITDTPEFKFGYHLGQIDELLKKHETPARFICSNCEKETGNAQNCEHCGFEMFPF